MAASSSRRALVSASSTATGCASSTAAVGTAGRSTRSSWAAAGTAGASRSWDSSSSSSSSFNSFSRSSSSRIWFAGAEMAAAMSLACSTSSVMSSMSSPTSSAVALPRAFAIASLPAVIAFMVSEFVTVPSIAIICCSSVSRAPLIFSISASYIFLRFRQYNAPRLSFFCIFAFASVICCSIFLSRCTCRFSKVSTVFRSCRIVCAGSCAAAVVAAVFFRPNKFILWSSKSGV
mmetsp:Transcript_21236/g.65539  ORF Transcript_21236/g.65539 Transcript_21236/m.65539 type:complete len:233 (-) Transcript_21236:172-870(-)